MVTRPDIVDHCSTLCHHLFISFLFLVDQPPHASRLRPRFAPVHCLRNGHANAASAACGMENCPGYRELLRTSRSHPWRHHGLMQPDQTHLYRMVYSYPGATTVIRIAPVFERGPCDQPTSCTRVSSVVRIWRFLFRTSADVGYQYVIFVVCFSLHATVIANLILLSCAKLHSILRACKVEEHVIR